MAPSGEDMGIQSSSRRPVPGPSREKRTSTPGDIFFIALRLLDVPLQLWLLSYSTPQTNTSSSLLSISQSLPAYHAVIFALVCITSLRHVYWKLYVSEQLLAPPYAIVVGLFNTALNTFNILFSLWPYTSLSPPPPHPQILPLSPTHVLALALFILGSLLETISERSRRTYKTNRKYTPLPRLYTQHLFAQARHPNYGGSLLWRIGFALFCGGWVWGVVVGCYFTWYFSGTAVPALEDYMERSYGQQWKAYKQRVKYILLPGIY